MILFDNIPDKSYMFKNCEDLIDFSFFSYDNIKEKKEKENEEIEKIENENNEILIKNYLNEDNLIENIDGTNPDEYSLYDNINLNKINNYENETISKVSLANIYSLNKTIKSVNNQLIDIGNKIILKEAYRNFKGMFYQCSYLKKISGISDLNTNDVSNMAEMFYSCRS